MSAVQQINPHAESIRRAQALLINVGAAKGLQEVLKSNLGAPPESAWGGTRAPEEGVAVGRDDAMHSLAARGRGR